MVFRLSLLGPLDLKSDGSPPADGVLRRPKLVALLSYLALGPRDAYHRKDTLLGLFWPETTQTQARHALRQALYMLRRELGEEAVLTRGDEEVALNRQVITTDVEAFEIAVKNGRETEAMALYRGDLLRGFYLTDAPAFEEWLERERTRRRRQAVGAVRTVMDRDAASGREREAAQWGRRLLELSPHDEAALRRVMELLERCGDRGDALHLYHEFTKRLATDLELEPSAETLALVQRIRRDGSGSTVVRSPVDGGTSEPTREREATRRRSRLIPVGAAGVVIAAIAVVAIVSQRATGTGLVTNRVVVVPFENHTDDTSLASLGRYVAFHTTQVLVHLPELDVVPASEVTARLGSPQGDTAAAPPSPLALAQEIKAALLVQGYYTRSDGQLEFHSQLVDVQEGIVETSLEPVRGPADGPVGLVANVAERVAGSMLARFGGEYPLLSTASLPSLQVFQAYQQGVDHFKAHRYGQAAQRFRAAIHLDSSFVPPYFWLGYSLSVTWQPGALDSVTQALDRIASDPATAFTPSERVALDQLEALVLGDRARILGAARRATRLDPTATWLRVFAAFEALQSNRPSEAIELWQVFDDDDRPYPGVWLDLTSAHHLMGDHGSEYRIALRARERFADAPPTGPGQSPRDFLAVRSLIGLGRIEEALDLLDNSVGLSTFQQWLVYLGLEFERHGHDSAATLAYEHALRRYEAIQGEQATRLFPRYWRGIALTQLGRLEEAQAVFLQLQIDFPGVAAAPLVSGHLGVVEAELGNGERARQIADSLASLERPYLYGKHLAWSARIAAALGERERAVSLLRQAFAQGLVYNALVYVDYHNIWHSDAYFEPLWGYEPFEELMRPKG